VYQHDDHLDDDDRSDLPGRSSRRRRGRLLRHLGLGDLRRGRQPRDAGQARRDPPARVLELHRWAREAAERLARPKIQAPPERAAQDEAVRAHYRDAAARAWKALHSVTQPNELRLFIEQAIVRRGELLQYAGHDADPGKRKTAKEQTIASLALQAQKELRSVFPWIAKDLNLEHLKDALRAFPRRNKKGGPPKGEKSWSSTIGTILEELGLGEIEPASHAKNVRRAAKRKP
jgi:hypothetical protein